MPAIGAKDRQLTGWRAHTRSFVKAMLFAAALLGHAYLAFGLTVNALLTFRHAQALLGVWAAALGLGVALTWRARGWRVSGTFLLCLVAVTGLGAWFERGPARDELPADGDVLVAALAQHFQAHGRYPGSLEELGASLRRNAFGGWRYEPHDDGRSYSLSCGEYHLDLFVLYRSAEDEAWRWDT
jgi:hypothetical protein